MHHRLLSVICALSLGASVAATLAGAEIGKAEVSTESTRYGLFDLLDHRSVYGEGLYPEPFLVDESDREDTEFRFDWLHTATAGLRVNEFKFEVEKGVGPVTFELEFPIDRQSTPDGTLAGTNNIDLGVRRPVFQWVSPGRLIDTTFGVAFEWGIPTHSSLSRNSEIVPKVFNDLCIAKHFTLQSILGYSRVMGPHEDSGLCSFEYGFIAGYNFTHDQLPISGVLSVTPMLEFSGEKPLNHDQSGTNILTGNAAIRVSMRSIGPMQPKIGLGYVFALNQAARDDVHSGVALSFIFEY